MKLFSSGNRMAHNNISPNAQNWFAKNCRRIALATTSIIVLGASAAGCGTGLSVRVDIPQQRKLSIPCPPESAKPLRQPKEDTDISIFIRRELATEDIRTKVNAALAFRLANSRDDGINGIIITAPVVDRLLEDIAWAVR